MGSNQSQKEEVRSDFEQRYILLNKSKLCQNTYDTLIYSKYPLIYVNFENKQRQDIVYGVREENRQQQMKFVVGMNIRLKLQKELRKEIKQIELFQKDKELLNLELQVQDFLSKKNPQRFIQQKQIFQNMKKENKFSTFRTVIIEKGYTLTDYIQYLNKRQERMPKEIFIKIVHQILEICNELSTYDIIMLDLKLENFWIMGDLDKQRFNQPNFLKFLCYRSLSCNQKREQFDTNLNKHYNLSNEIPGSLTYLAPEQYEWMMESVNNDNNIEKTHEDFENINNVRLQYLKYNVFSISLIMWCLLSQKKSPKFLQVNDQYQQEVLTKQIKELFCQNDLAKDLELTCYQYDSKISLLQIMLDASKIKHYERITFSQLKENWDKFVDMAYQNNSQYFLVSSHLQIKSSDEYIYILMSMKQQENQPHDLEFYKKYYEKLQNYMNKVLFPGEIKLLLDVVDTLDKIEGYDFSQQEEATEVCSYALDCLGIMYYQLNKYERVYALFLKSYKNKCKLNRQTPEFRIRLAYNLYNLGVVSEILGKLSDAKDYLKQSQEEFLKIYQKINMPPIFYELECKLGKVCLKLQQNLDAYDYLIDAQKNKPQIDNIEKVYIDSLIAQVYYQNNQKETAQITLSKIEEAIKNLPNNINLTKILLNVIRIYCQQEKFEKAQELLTECLYIQLLILDKYNPELISSYNYQGLLYLQGGHFEKASEHFSKAKEILEKCIPHNNDLLGIIETNLKTAKLKYLMEKSVSQHQIQILQSQSSLYPTASESKLPLIESQQQLIQIM